MQLGSSIEPITFPTTLSWCATCYAMDAGTNLYKIVLLKIRKIKEDTNCHIHFPDGNIRKSPDEKSNQETFLII